MGLASSLRPLLSASISSWPSYPIEADILEGSKTAISRVLGEIVIPWLQA